MIDFTNYHTLESDNLRLSYIAYNQSEIYYSIYDKENNIIGNCGIRLAMTDKNYYYGNIGYEIFKEYQGHNYALEATKLLGRIALDNCIEKLNITTDPKNIASHKIIEKLCTKLIIQSKVPSKYKLSKNSKYVDIYEWDVKKEGMKK